MLVDLLTDNPIHCFSCKNEIDPEVLKLQKPLVDEIASWFRSYQALYALWLDSGEYESYAREKLFDKHGQVNIEGVRIAKQLAQYYPSYYWWFFDVDDDEPSLCPNCNNKLDHNVKHGIGKCDACHVLV